MPDELLTSVAREIERLHAFLVDWFRGTAVDSDDVFHQRFLGCMDVDGWLIPPNGLRMRIGDLAQGLRKGHGSNPEFDIRIRDVTLVRATPDVVVASYEEWQRRAINSTPPTNGRLSTVVFAREPTRLRWLHVHETWIPPELAADAELLFD